MLKTINKHKWLVVVLGGVFLLTLFPKASFASHYTVPKKEDAYIDFAHQRTDFNSRPYLLVADYTNPTTSERTLAGSFIKFESIPHHSGQALVKAEWHFRLLSHMGENNGRLKIRPTAHSWNESDVTWAHQPSSLDDSEHRVISNTIDLSTAGWKTVDITPLVQGWLDGSLDPEKGMSVFVYDSGRLLTIDRRNHPSYLTVEYRDNIGEGGGDEMGPADDSDDGVAERTEVLHLIFPGDDEKITDQTPTFVWSERNRSYDLNKLALVLKKENGDMVFETEVDLNGTSYTDARKLSPGKYKWYIKGFWNDEEVFKTDKNKFEIVAEEEGLTGERRAVEEETTTNNDDNTETENNKIPSYNAETENQNKPPVVSTSDSNNKQETNNRQNIYKWLTIALLVLIAGLLGWIAKSKTSDQKKSKQAVKVKKGHKKSEEKSKDK